MKLHHHKEGEMIFVGLGYTVFTIWGAIVVAAVKGMLTGQNPPHWNLVVGMAAGFFCAFLFFHVDWKGE